MCRLMRVVMLVGLTGGLCFLPSAQAVFPPPVKDEAKFFSKEALAKADKKIRDLYEKYKKDVVIETLPSLTAEQMKKLDEDGKNKYFPRLAREKAVALGLNGVYILLIKRPTHLQVHMDPDTQKKMFTTANRKALIEKIITQFRDDNFDQGLLDGLDLIEASFQVNARTK